MYVDFKETILNRVQVPPEKEESVKQLLKEGKITNSNELCLHIGLSSKYDMLLDTSEQMKPEQQEGFATIEAFDKDSIIYSNASWLI